MRHLMLAITKRCNIQDKIKRLTEGTHQTNDDLTSDVVCNY